MLIIIISIVCPALAFHFTNGNTGVGALSGVCLGHSLAVGEALPLELQPYLEGAVAMNAEHPTLWLGTHIAGRGVGV